MPSASESMKVRAAGSAPYLPWPEMRHSAKTLRKIAREFPLGSAHTISAVVVMTAFSVEAFCQTLGPVVLREKWTNGRRPAERWPVLDKLREIGKATGNPVDYGKEPWNRIADLFKARDLLAHAKPDPRKFDREFEVPEGVDPIDAVYASLKIEFQPLHNLQKLDSLAAEIDSALLPIWVAAGNSDYSFTWHGMNDCYVKAI